MAEEEAAAGVVKVHEGEFVYRPTGAHISLKLVLPSSCKQRRRPFVRFVPVARWFYNGLHVCTFLHDETEAASVMVYMPTAVSHLMERDVFPAVRRWLEEDVTQYCIACNSMSASNFHSLCKVFL